MSSSITKLVLLMSFLLTSFGVDLSYIVPTPPTFPQAFTVTFDEIEKLGPVTLSTNKGAWYYDFGNRRARYDHLQGQTNNFCGYQGLSPKDPKAPCRLYFTEEEDLIVYYPKSITCCRLCGRNEGCTILKPDWLKMGSKLVSVETINGVKCYGYGKPGAVTSQYGDVWYSDVGGMPCRYHEVVAHIDHNLTFVRDSFKVGPQSPDLFAFPRWCNKTCPHPYKPPHF